MKIAPVPPPADAPAPAAPVSFPRWLPPLFFLLLSVLFLWRSTLGGDVFLPAGLLGHVAPYRSVLPSDSLPPWNPLRWDGIAQFYPWRLFAAESIRQGRLPLWNPYQFCGTPFVANSQSAVFYPFNLLFALLPAMRAFAVSAVLHLTLCGWFTYLLLRRLKCHAFAALLGGTAFAFSAWQVAWLQLPTFLATSCWFPLLLLKIHELLLNPPAPFPDTLVPRREGGESKLEAFSSPAIASVLSANETDSKTRYSPFPVSAANALENSIQREMPVSPPSLMRSFLAGKGAGGLGLVVGLMLLAGHLQIAFYGLLAGTLWATALAVVRGKENGIRFAFAGVVKCGIGLVLGLMLALPQILPALELSRISHRAGSPTSAGFQAYTEYALPVSHFAALTLPDFFGGDSDANNPYWGYYVKDLGDVQIGIRHNAAETANYVGIVTLLLAIFALVRGRQKTAEGRRKILFFGGLALLALLMALGTPINALFYFGVPGFGQSGSPGRVLVLWAFALSILAAFGLDALLKASPSPREKLAVGGSMAFVFALGLLLSSRALSAPPQGMPLPLPSLGDVFARISADWLRLIVFALGGTLLFSSLAEKTFGKGRLNSAAPLAVGLVVFDLFWAGTAANPTAPASAVYPATPGIKVLQAQAGHERIFPVNKFWSLYAAPPVVLPPNGAMVFGLRDVQGYDSLLTKQYKEFANTFARADRTGNKDAAPPEVGNLIFAQNPNAPNALLTGAKFAVTPGTADKAFGYLHEGMPPGAPLYDAHDDMAIYALPGRSRAALLAGGQTLAAPIWTEDSPTRITLKTEANTAAALVLADPFYPGWTAALDNRPVPVERAADAPVFRAVAVPAGSHTITFRYEPASIRVGLYFACFACLLITASFTAGRMRSAAGRAA